MLIISTTRNAPRSALTKLFLNVALPPNICRTAPSRLSLQEGLGGGRPTQLKNPGQLPSWEEEPPRIGRQQRDTSETVCKSQIGAPSRIFVRVEACVCIVSKMLPLFR